MSDFELLSIVLMILSIVVTLLLKIIEKTNTKNNPSCQIMSLTFGVSFIIYFYSNILFPA